MGKKIVVLFEVHSIETYERRYDYKTLVKQGYQLDICDMSGVISEYYGAGYNKLDDTDAVKYLAFSSRQSFKQYIDDLESDTFIWSTFQLTAEYYWIFKTISKHHYGFICNDDYVFPIGEERKKEKSYWTKWSLSRVRNAVLYRMPRKFIPIRKADVVITYGAGDEERKLRNVLYDEHTIVELTNTIDYNECMYAIENAGDKGIQDLPDEYIVFIDAYMPYHPDGLVLGMNIDASRYYREVEEFLRRVSDFTGLPVIVAAHPKADYMSHSECYQGMRIIQFKTAELISRARLVITHISISISMIMIYRKPFMLITTDEVRKVIYTKGIEEAQEQDISVKTINISNRLSDDDVKRFINEAEGLKEEYFERQILKYRLPQGHPNEFLSFGNVMIKAMKQVESSENQKI